MNGPAGRLICAFRKQLTSEASGFPAASILSWGRAAGKTGSLFFLENVRRKPPFPFGKGGFGSVLIP